MVDFSGIGGSAIGWLQTWVFWLAIGLLLAGGFIGGLLIRKRRKLKYPSCEIVPLGGGTVGLLIKDKGAGYFKKKKTLFGLLDFGGEEELTLKDGRKVFNSSSEDFIEINGRRGVLVTRKGDDPEIVVQVASVNLGQESRKMLMEIAPGDYRDAADDLMNRAEREMMKKWEKILPYVAVALIIIGAIIAIIVVIQFANHNLDKSYEIYAKSQEAGSRTPEVIGQEVGKAIRDALNEPRAASPSAP